jgi:CMP/dCMP kinase
MIIAIDGPAGSGKSTTAQAVANELGFRHLDSGAFYRAITYAAMQQGWPVPDWKHLSSEQLNSLKITVRPADPGFAILIDGKDAGQDIRTPEVNANVSAMARVPAVRDWLMETLREAGRLSNLVADGRDIGTVVFPDAELKIFLVADSRERARRRLLQMGSVTDDEHVDAEVARIEARDKVDSTRDVAPLRKAPDAIELDTTGLDFGQQVQAITALWRKHIAGRQGPA